MRCLIVGLVLLACVGCSRDPGAEGTTESLSGGAAAPRAATVGDTGASGARGRASSPLTEEGYALGAEGASLVVYEISDFGCRYCGEFARESFPELRRAFVDGGRVRWVFLPSAGAYPNAAEAARAAICAGEQERFWGMHDLLFARQREWMSPRDPERILAAYAQRVGVDSVRFAACYRGPEARERLARAGRLSLLMGIRATPSFFVGGRLVEGALSARLFGDLLEEALAARGER